VNAQEIERFNSISMFITTEIVKTSSLPRRKAVLEKVINIIVHLESLNNFNTSMALIAACNAAPVYRKFISLMSRCSG
jgi:hypothetical protein